MTSQIVVLGANGFIGKRIVTKAKAAGRNVITVDKSSADFELQVPEDNNRLFELLSDLKNDLYITNTIALNPKVEDVSDIPKDDFSDYMKLNLQFPYELSMKILSLAQSNSAFLYDVVHLGSLYASRGSNFRLYNGSYKAPGYVASKHGLVGMVKAINGMKLCENFRINVISPGVVLNPRMPVEFQQKFKDFSNGHLNDVDELADYIVDFAFKYWTLYRGQEIKLVGGAYV